MDTKIGVVVGALGVAIGFLFVSGLTLWVRIVLGILLGISVLSAAAAFFPTGYLSAPDPAAVDTLSALPDPTLKTLFIENILSAFEANLGRLERKAFLFRLALGALLVAALFSVVARVAGLA
jgi:hypothetical protein